MVARTLLLAALAGACGGRLATSIEPLPFDPQSGTVTLTLLGPSDVRLVDSSIVGHSRTLEFRLPDAYGSFPVPAVPVRFVEDDDWGEPRTLDAVGGSVVVTQTVPGTVQVQVDVTLEVPGDPSRELRLTVDHGAAQVSGG